MTAVIIGKGLLEIAPVANVITGSVKSICGLIDSMSSRPGLKTNYTDFEAYEFIDALDIRNKLDTYSLLINEFPGTRSQSVKSSLIGVQNVIIEIESQLKNIKTKIDYNKQLWVFSSMRSYSVTKDLKVLEKLINKLDSRIESLKTVTEISKLWNSRLFVPLENKPLAINYVNSYYPNSETNENKCILSSDANGSLSDSKIYDLTSYIIINKEGTTPHTK